MPIIPLPVHQVPDRFYRGGARIRAFRGIAGEATHEPEDWIASTAAVFGTRDLGTTVLPDGTPLPAAIADRPEAFLGSAHVAARGVDPALLTKMLDAGERLPVHVHPDDAFARAHVRDVDGRPAPCGKTEAWYMLGPAEVHLGFRRAVSAEELARAVDEQRTDELLAMLHPLHVEAGDTVLVPAGMPHAIGEGALLIEVQQPTDQSVLLEWEGFAIDGRADGHLGLGFERALQAVDRRVLLPEEAEALISRRDAAAGAREEALVSAARAVFGIREHDASSPAALPTGYQVLVVLAGSARLTAEGEEPWPLERGTVLLIPFETRAVLTDRSADLLALSCTPPAPTRSEPAR